MIENDLKDFIIAKNVIRSYKGTKSRVVIPNGITGIGPGAFYQNDNITSIIMPDSIVSVSRKAFSLCSNLKSVRFSKNLNWIGADAFSYCFGLNTITLYPGLEIVRPRAFTGCHNIKNIYLPDTLKEIGKDSFVKYNPNCIIHTPLGTKANEYAVANDIPTDQKNAPNKQYEPVLPNENNYKDPEAIRFFRTGNYGVADDESDENDDFEKTEGLESDTADYDSDGLGRTFDMAASFSDEVIEEEPEPEPESEGEEEEKEEKKPEEPKEEEPEEDPPRRRNRRRGSIRRNDQRLKEIIIKSVACIFAAGLLALGALFVINYNKNSDGFIEASGPKDLIIPFNMAYNYALQNDQDSFVKQIRYLGLNKGAENGILINDDFIMTYLQNGSLEGFIRRYSIIYSFGIGIDSFNDDGATDTVDHITGRYLVPFEDEYFESLKDTGGYYADAKTLASTVDFVPKPSAGYECSYYGDFAVETKSDNSYSTYYYKGIKMTGLPDFYHVENNSEFSVGLNKNEDDHYLFYFISELAARYAKAVNLFDMSKYEEAQIIFEEIAGYQDSDDRRISCKYNIAVQQIEGNNYFLAYALLADVVSLRNNEEDGKLFNEVREKLYEQGVEYYEEELYDESNPIFKLIIDYKDSRERIHTHEYKEEVITEATCYRTGLLRKTCSCGKVVNEIIPYKDHDYDSYISVEPTCSTTGERICTCKVCGHVYHEKVPTTEHTYAQADCVTPEICTVCGHQHGEPLGHHYSDSCVCDRCGYDYGENIRLIADCLPFDVESYLWGENHYIVSCSHKVVHNVGYDRMDLVIEWKNSDPATLGYGSLTYSLVANIYDQNGTLVKKEKEFYFKQGVATTYVYNVSDNMDYYVDLNIYLGSTKIK